MKILLVHNFYGSGAPSGENRVYAAERELVRQHGQTVVEFTRHSDEIINRGMFGTIQGGLATPWNPFSKRALRSVLEKEKPDVMHVHNTFPLISPSIFHARKGLRTATVLTLHNDRSFCAAAITMRDGVPCTGMFGHAKCISIVVEHQGTIQVRSGATWGGILVIRLPIQPPAPSAAGTSPS